MQANANESPANVLNANITNVSNANDSPTNVSNANDSPTNVSNANESPTYVLNANANDNPTNVSNANESPTYVLNANANDSPTNVSNANDSPTNVSNANESPTNVSNANESPTYVLNANANESPANVLNANTNESPANVLNGDANESPTNVTNESPANVLNLDANESPTNVTNANALRANASLTLLSTITQNRNSVRMNGSNETHRTNGEMDLANGNFNSPTDFAISNCEEINGLDILPPRDGPNCNDLILMVNDHSGEQRDEQLLLEIDAEQTLELHALELEEQKDHDREMGQLKDDINHHLDSKIVEILHEIDRREESDSVCSSVNVFNEASEWWVEPPDSDDEDHPSHSTSIEPPLIDGLEVDGTYDEGGYYDTDTEDGAAEHIALIEANTQLIAFLKRQSVTIARLRQRVLRLRGHITELTSNLIILQDMQSIWTQSP
jgi:hypothetical protein